MSFWERFVEAMYHLRVLFYLLIHAVRANKLPNQAAKSPPRHRGVLMAYLHVSSLFFTLVFLFSSMLTLGDFDLRVSWGVDSENGLCPEFYDFSCPQANEIVMSVLRDVISQEPRMAASLIRLHFHDCFVQGCDASVLLDDSGTIVSEKRAAPNVNSLRGFEVIDEIKAKIEEACPETVSCADILALAARGSSLLSGGPFWNVPLGRKDSKAANPVLANSSIPAPTSTVQNLVASFNQQGLDHADLVALSGAHTIGVARCTSFKQRLYNQNGDNQPDLTLERTYSNELRSVCPPSGGDNNISPLDYASPVRFDNTYFKLILGGRGLLSSDETLLTGGDPSIAELIKTYAEDEGLFFGQFALSMVKMGNVSPLSGSKGEVRRDCRVVNSVE